MSTTTNTTGAGVSLRRSQPRLGERVIEAVLFLAALISVLTTIGIVIAIIGPTIEFFQEPAVSLWDFLTGTEWTVLFADQNFGVLPLVTATLTTTVIALLVAIPIGLGAAIYLAEYASPRARKVLKPILEVLAGIPTVVYGFFALAFITPQILQRLIDIGTFSMLSAGLVMGIMIVPTVASLSEDAMTAVPQSSARRRLRPGQHEDACGDQGGRAGGDLGDRRGLRSRHQPGDRRDDDRRAGGRQQPRTSRSTRSSRPRR